MENKICTKCNRLKSLDEFRKKTYKVCTECIKDNNFRQMNKRRQLQLEKNNIILPLDKLCFRCEEYLPSDNFGLNKNNYFYLNGVCKVCKKKPMTRDYEQKCEDYLKRYILRY